MYVLDLPQVVRAQGDPTTAGREIPFVRDTATCASCRRPTTTLCLRKHAVDTKCTHCSRLIEPTEDVEVIDADQRS